MRLREIHANELAKTEALIANSINYFLFKLISDYISAEVDADTEEYKWAVNKANWIKNSTEQVNTILTEEDRAKLIKAFMYGDLK